jgi:hypothetical protein
LEREWYNDSAKKLVKRLFLHRDELLMFLYCEAIPFDNNHAERTIRNGITILKNCNRSAKGVETQEIKMSIFHSLKQKNIDTTTAIINAIKAPIKTGKSPTMQKNK